jgi:site-specific DNA-methyltransferase (adenine-specific)
MNSTLYRGDCIQELKSLDKDSIGACVTDPPYFLTEENTIDTYDLLQSGSKKSSGGFLDRSWDGGDVEVVYQKENPFAHLNSKEKWIKVNGYFVEPENIRQLKEGNQSVPVYKKDLNVYYEFCKLWAKELFRVLKPGAHLCSFSGTRTYHSMTQAIEDVGFRIRDSIHWTYGNGFPKSMNISKRIDNHKGLEQEYLAESPWGPSQDEKTTYAQNGRTTHPPITKPNSEEAHKYEGYGTAMKPAHEPIVVAMKPIEGTYVENLLKHGTGAINIDRGRVDTKKESFSIPQSDPNKRSGGLTGDLGISDKDVEDFQKSQKESIERLRDKGRFPSNVILDKYMAKRIDEQAGERPSTGDNPSDAKSTSLYRPNREDVMPQGPLYSDKGGPSRYFKQIEWDIEEDDTLFYCSKPSRSERSFGDVDNPHPTLKPVRLMWYLIKLFVPEDESVIDPFMGSGTTGCAAMIDKKDFVGIEREEESFQTAKERIEVFRTRRKEVVDKFVNKEDVKPQKDMSDEHDFW